MKKLFLAGLLLFALNVHAQNYNNILNYSLNGIPTYGVKIKTNMPFTPSSHMPTIKITGYNYGANESIELTLVYYVYRGTDFDPANFYFYQSSVSSSGAYTPIINLSNENGKVVIYINDKSFYQRFTISVYEQGMSGALPEWFQGWTAVDEPLGGTKIIEVPYHNRFKGEISLPEGIWNTQGNVGIGTISPQERLSVNGKIRAQEIKVETNNWPDYVFARDYQLPTLQETEKQIKEKGHLPGIPSAAEVKANGIDLGDMNSKLLQKIEELTLQLIEINKKVAAQQLEINQLKSRP